MANWARLAIPRSAAPFSGGPTTSCQIPVRMRVDDHGRLSTKAITPAATVAASPANTVIEPRATSVARTMSTAAPSSTRGNTGTKAATTAVIIPNAMVIRRRWALGTRTTASATESSVFSRPSTVDSPLIRRTRSSAQGIAPYVASTPQRPLAIAVYGSGTAA